MAGAVLTAAQADDWAQGVLTSAQITANSSATSGTTPLDVITASAVTLAAANRRIKLTADWRSISGTVVGDDFLVQIKEGSTVLKEHVIRITASAVGIFAGTIVHLLTSPSSGSHTYKLTLVRDSGTGTATMQAAATYPAQLIIEDCGTA